jgi:hypothetical protein
MLSLIEHKTQFGFYDIILLGDQEADFTYTDTRFPERVLNIEIIEPEKVNCVACFQEITIAEEFSVIYTGCESRRHPYCHSCFHRHCEKLFDFEETDKGPERLQNFECCTICRTKCKPNGEWRNAKYFPTFKRWKIGKILPDGISIIGVHQRMNLKTEEPDSDDSDSEVDRSTPKHQYNNSMYLVSYMSH